MRRERQASGVHGAEVDAVHLDGARLRVVEPAEQLGQRGLAGAVLADDGERRAGGDGEVEAREHRQGTGDALARAAALARTAALARGGGLARAVAVPLARAGGRVGEGDLAEPDLARRHPCRRDGAGGALVLDQRPGALRGRPQAQHRGDRRRGAVERPGEAAEGDHAGARGGAGEGHQPAQRQAAAGRGGAQGPEDDEVGGEHQQQAPEDRALAQPGGLPAQLRQALAARPEALDDPVAEAEQPQLLGSRRLDRETVGVVRMALRLAHLLGVAVAPDAALAQQPVGGEPGAAEQQRRPPGPGGEHHRRGDAAHPLHQPGGDEVHRDGHRRTADAEIEVARHREVGGEPRTLEVPHARRPHAGDGELIVEPGRRPAAEVGAGRLVDRRQHLQQHEHDSDRRQRRRQAAPPLHRAHQRPHRDREQRRQQPAQHEDGPPGRRQRAAGRRQHGREAHVVTRAQALERGNDQWHYRDRAPAAAGKVVGRSRTTPRRPRSSTSTLPPDSGSAAASRLST